MPQVHAPTPLQSRADRWLPAILLLNVVCQVGIVVTGGLVRLTGSGLGCPTWPQCVPGSYTPVREQAQGMHKYIEFGNRTLTGVLLVVAVAAFVAVMVARPSRRDLKVATGLVLGGVLLQALLGGLTVLLGLHPITVAVHFLVSAALVAVATFAYAVRAAPLSTLSVPPLVSRLAAGTCAVGVVVLVLGTVVTGSGPHSGDADAPARFGFDPRTISWLHADAVMLFVGLVVATWIAVRLTAGDDGRAARAWRVVLLVTLAQGLVGYTQYLTGLPWVIVLVHMLGAVLLVVALTYGYVALRMPQTTPASGDPAPAPEPVSSSR